MKTQVLTPSPSPKARPGCKQHCGYARFARHQRIPANLAAALPSLHCQPKLWRDDVAWRLERREGEKEERIGKTVMMNSCEVWHSVAMKTNHILVSIVFWLRVGNLKHFEFSIDLPEWKTSCFLGIMAFENLRAKPRCFFACESYAIMDFESALGSKSNTTQIWMKAKKCQGETMENTYNIQIIVYIYITIHVLYRYIYIYTYI